MSNMQYVENLEALLAAVEAQPENLFNLNSWKENTECGTCFCVAGLACSMPKFQELGMKWDLYNTTPTFEGKDMWEGGGDSLFGPSSFYGLFAVSGEGSHDKVLGFDYSYDMYDDLIIEGTDKELAIARLKHRINKYKEEANAKPQ